MRIELEIDTAGVSARAGTPDILIAHARVLDSNGTLCVSDTSTIAFTIEGDATLIGSEQISAEAGIASVVVKVPSAGNAFKLHAVRNAPADGFAASCSWKRG